MDSLLITKLVLILSLLIAATGAVMFILFMLSFVLGGAPFVPTPSKVLQRMIELADIKPGEKVYDLGCGDGRLVIEANRKYQAVSSQPISPVESQFKITVEMGKTSGKAMVPGSHTVPDELSERQTRQL